MRRQSSGACEIRSGSIDGCCIVLYVSWRQFQFVTTSLLPFQYQWRMSLEQGNTSYTFLICNYLCLQGPVLATYNFFPDVARDFAFGGQITEKQAISRNQSWSLTWCLESSKLRSCFKFWFASSSSKRQWKYPVFRNKCAKVVFLGRDSFFCSWLF